MSDRPSSRLSWLPRVGLLTACLVGSLAFSGGSLVAVAQDASPSPMGDCVPGTPDTSMATPAASPMADEAAAAPVATPADDATVEAATAFVTNAAACTADPAGLSTLVTVALVNQLGGYESVEAALADGFFEGAAFSSPEIGDVATYDDGSVGVDVSYQQTQYQLVSEEWSLIQVGGEWKLNALNPGPRLEPEGDTAAVGVNLVENGDGTYTVAPNAASVVETDVIILQAINAEGNAEPHELVVIKLPEGADPSGIIDGTITEEDVEFIGQVFVPEPGTSVDMYLLGLPAGVYTLACFVPTEEGDPHAFHGMMTPFEVTAPVEEASPAA